jgi:adenylate cyclase
VFDVMWPLTKGRRLTKRRHFVRDGELTWEIDAFSDRDMVLAEIELPDEEHSVEPPEWLAPHVVRDVTEEPAFANSALAR